MFGAMTSLTGGGGFTGGASSTGAMDTTANYTTEAGNVTNGGITINPDKGLNFDASNPVHIGVGVLAFVAVGGLVVKMLKGGKSS